MIKIPTKSWFLTEIVASITLLVLLFRANVNNKFNIINFHIAYPNLTYWHIIKRFVKIPIIITEHWSAYHLNFGINKKLPRIQRIFRQKIPVIAVSNALVIDIKEFAQSNFPSFVVPNIVDSDVFYPDPKVNREPFFFMVSQWKPPKDPFVVLKAFKSFSKRNSKYKLIIGGFGNQWNEIEKWINKKDIAQKIKLTGPLSSNSIADYMRKCAAFLHPSKYETFSVVCAEAVNCHTPIVASNVGGIPEIIDEQSILVKEHTVGEWILAMETIVHCKQSKRKSINKFSVQTIGRLYYHILESIVVGS